MAWWRVGSEEEDKTIAGAADELLSGISDADLVNKVKNATALNLRDQISVSEANDWRRESELRKMKNRN